MFVRMMPGSTALTDCGTLRLFVQEEMVMLLVLKEWGTWGDSLRKIETKICETMPSEWRCYGEGFENRVGVTVPPELRYNEKQFRLC